MSQDLHQGVRSMALSGQEVDWHHLKTQWYSWELSEEGLWPTRDGQQCWYQSSGNHLQTLEFLELVRRSSGYQGDLSVGIGWPASANFRKEEHLFLCISIVHQFFSVTAARAAVAKLSAKILAPEQAFHLLDAVSCQTQANIKEVGPIEHCGEGLAPTQLVEEQHPCPSVFPYF